MGDVIGRPVNGWQLRLVKGAESLTKTSYATLTNGRLIIDVYGVGGDGFVPFAEFIDMAEAVRQGGAGLLELINRAEAVMPVRFEVSRDRYGKLYVRGYTLAEGVQVYDMRYEEEGESTPATKLKAAEGFLRDLIGTSACLPSV